MFLTMVGFRLMMGDHPPTAGRLTAFMMSMVQEDRKLNRSNTMEQIEMGKGQRKGSLWA